MEKVYSDEISEEINPGRPPDPEGAEVGAKVAAETKSLHPNEDITSRKRKNSNEYPNEGETATRKRIDKEKENSDSEYVENEDMKVSEKITLGTGSSEQQHTVLESPIQNQDASQVNVNIEVTNQDDSQVERNVNMPNLESSQVNSEILNQISTAISQDHMSNEDVDMGTANPGEVGDHNNGPQVSGLIILEFIDKSKEEGIIHDRDTVRYMLDNSPFGTTYSGRPVFQFSTHSLKLFINDSREIHELLKIDKLSNEEGDWPVKCRVPIGMPGVQNIGVLKNVHPQVKVERVKTSLLRNGEQVIDVARIENRFGPTWVVKITFENNVPEQVYYDGQYRYVDVYRPPQRTLMCNNCSKPGHKADDCNSRPRCPQCSQGHGQKNCPLLKGPINNALKKCPNCPGNHSAKYGNCPFFKRAKQIQDIRYRQKIPIQEAKNVWEEREKARREQISRNSDQSNTRMSYAQSGNQTPNNHANQINNPSTRMSNSQTGNQTSNNYAHQVNDPSTRVSYSQSGNQTSNFLAHQINYPSTSHDNSSQSFDQITYERNGIENRYQNRNISTASTSTAPYSHQLPMTQDRVNQTNVTQLNQISDTKPNTANAETQTILTVSDPDLELMIKPDNYLPAETATNLVTVLLEFIDIQYANVDTEAKKSRAIRSVKDTFGVNVTTKSSSSNQKTSEVNKSSGLLSKLFGHATQTSSSNSKTPPGVQQSMRDRNARSSRNRETPNKEYQNKENVIYESNPAEIEEIQTHMKNLNLPPEKNHKNNQELNHNKENLMKQRNSKVANQENNMAHSTNEECVKSSQDKNVDSEETTMECNQDTGNINLQVADLRPDQTSQVNKLANPSNENRDKWLLKKEFRKHSSESFTQLSDSDSDADMSTMDDSEKLGDNVVQTAILKLGQWMKQ